LDYIEAGFGADAVTFLGDGGKQGDYVWHIDWASWTNQDAREHELHRMTLVIP
jgi:hypothetical protein